MRRVTVFVLAGLLVGCSGPPLKERQQADDAIAAAQAAGAAAFAPDVLRAAEYSLKAYDAAVAQRDFRQALSSALEARDRGYEAVKTATDQKSVFASRRDALVTDTKALVATAQTHLTSQKSSRSATDRLRRSIRTANTVMQEAGTTTAGAGKDDLKVVVGRLVAASDGLRKDLAAYEAAGKKRATG
jgi:hypothetical protein